MIDITYKPLRKTYFTKTTYPSSPPPVSHLHGETGSLFKQAKEREARIKEMLSGISYVEGETVTPYIQAERDKWGDRLTVEKICDSYAKFGKNEDWPKSNSPMIITVYNSITRVRFHCTPAYVIPLNADGSTPTDKDKK
jgi:hypothetical protein